MKLQHIVCLICILLASACTSTRQYYNKDVKGWENNLPDPDAEVDYEVYLIGDAGKPSAAYEEPNFRYLNSLIKDDSKKSSLVFLGDNLYPHGLYFKRHPQRDELERRLDDQLKIAKGYKGDVYFIPGNHDWAQGRPQGFENAINQEEYVEEESKKTEFLPDDGCPGPVEIELQNDFVLILLNTQWWLHYWEKPEGNDAVCDAKDDSEFIGLLEDMVLRNKGKKILVVGHHPMRTYGNHGARFSWKSHIFPLTDISDNLYIPLPILGSLYPLYRSVFGDVQDTRNFRYKELISSMKEVFDQHPNLIYAAGHEHSLQYEQWDSLHHIVSGSGYHTDYMGKSKKADFILEEVGFAKLTSYKNGDMWLEYRIPEGEGKSGKVVYRKKLFNSVYEEEEKKDYSEIDYTGQYVELPASKQYKLKGTGRAFLGSNYRDDWRDTVRIPVFDIGTAKGGLRIIQRGGGQQTRSLRLEDSRGKQYVLRTVEKFAENALPEDIRGSFAGNMVQDGISQSHPYASLTIPTMASAAGVYHTNPKIVYIPDDPRLGKHRADFKGYFCLFEERPAGNREDVPSFGKSKDIENTLKVIKKTQKDSDYRVDQEQVLRSRLFDILIGDWDRHDDQWRWASFEEGDLTIFQPIPRDRDQTYFWANGFLTWFQGRKWTVRKLQGFHHRIRDIEGLAFNARWFDRTFLTQPSKAQWLAYADTIKQSITDDVIDQAMEQFPEKIKKRRAAVIKSKLQQRRDDLKQYAEDYYLFLAKEVDIIGTKKRELFIVDRLNDEETLVQMFKLKKDGEKKDLLYERTFNRKETKEIRLYGLDGDDEFRLKGEVRKGIKIRIIAGEGEDEIKNDASVSGPLSKTHLYDFPDDFKLKDSKDIHQHISKKPEINAYDRKSFQYDYLGPVAFTGFNPDDGIFVGGGVNILRHGFRKDPFKSSHTIKGNFAFRTSSFNAVYNGVYTELIGKWDLLLEANAFAPNFAGNFFGFGNNSVFEKDSFDERYYNLRLNLYEVIPAVRKTLGGFATFTFGGKYQNVDIVAEDEVKTDNRNRFIYTDSIPGTNPATLFERKQFAGPIARFTIDTRDNQVNTKRGYLFNVEGYWLKHLDVNGRDFFHLESDLSFYLTFLVPLKTTLAARVGYAENFGEYELYQANALGGTTNLRGTRRRRFIGDRSFYQNTDLRIKFADLKSVVLNGEFGMVGFYDIGRVWWDGDPDKSQQDPVWHQGYGGGLYITPFNMFALNAVYSISQDDRLFFLYFGFLF